MQPEFRYVLQTPMTELWDAQGITLSLRRQRDLAAPEIKDLLRHGPCSMVMADPGRKLQWLSPTEVFDFWKGQVRTHLAAPDATPSLDDFSGGYYFRASLWESEDRGPVVLLEKHH